MRVNYRRARDTYSEFDQALVVPDSNPSSKMAEYFHRAILRDATPLAATRKGAGHTLG
jgi:hypothetical protein